MDTLPYKEPKSMVVEWDTKSIGVLVPNWNEAVTAVLKLVWSGFHPEAKSALDNLEATFKRWKFADYQFRGEIRGLYLWITQLAGLGILVKWRYDQYSEGEMVIDEALLQEREKDLLATTQNAYESMSVIFDSSHRFANLNLEPLAQIQGQTLPVSSPSEPTTTFTLAKVGLSQFVAETTYPIRWWIDPGNILRSDPMHRLVIKVYNLADMPLTHVPDLLRSLTQVGLSQMGFIEFFDDLKGKS